MEKTTKEKKYTIEELRKAGSSIWVKCETKEEANKLWKITYGNNTLINNFEKKKRNFSCLYLFT